jgi:hypothetical protein
MKKIKQILANLNWAQRDRDLRYIESQYDEIRDLPRRTNNQMSLESFQCLCEYHNQSVDKMLDKYGRGWESYLNGFKF